MKIDKSALKGRWTEARIIPAKELSEADLGHDIFFIDGFEEDEPEYHERVYGGFLGQATYDGQTSVMVAQQHDLLDHDEVAVLDTKPHSGSVQDQVREFHEVFGLFIGDKPSAAIPNELVRLRSRLLDEEVEEVFEAVLDGDVAQIAKELADVVYIAYGTALTYGIDLDKVISAVHVSNMSKRAADGTVLRRSDGKVQKSEHYVPPNIKEVLGL